MEVKPGYKQTEVGVIPEEWEVKRLGELAALKNGYAFKSDTYTTLGNFKVITIANVQDGYMDARECNSITCEPKDLQSHQRLQIGDILISMTGNVGRVCRVTEKNCLLNQRVGKLIPTAVDDAMLFILLSQPSFIKAMTGVAKGGAQPNLSVSEISDHRFCVPEALPEQRAIATALSDVDGLLGGLDRLIAKKRDLKQAAMQQLLTGQTRLPGFHGEWEAAQVQDVIAGFFCGPSPTCDERNIHDDEWGVLKTTAATKENGWDWTKHKTLPRAFWNKPQIELKKGDLIVTKAGPRHRVGVTARIDYVPPRIIPSGKMIALRPRPDKVVPLMLAAAISARDAQVYLDQRTTGMAESQVNFENAALLEAPITIPRIEEQTAIASVLSEMDGELAALERRREKTRALKQAMMQELLTGRIRLVVTAVSTSKALK
jgi:type I restriction enzyme S subunit